MSLIRRLTPSIVNHLRQFTSNALPLLAPSQAQTPVLQVSEVFSSVQGEGPFTGRPSVFLRLGVCNLSCAWCDTPYTWLFDNHRLEKVHSRIAASRNSCHQPLPKLYRKETELSKRDILDVRAEIASLAGESIRAVVITGGEPLLHKKPLLTMIPDLTNRGFNVEIETNGTICPLGLPDNLHLNVSPKLSNSLQPEATRLNYQVLKHCLSFRSSILKFVIGEAADINEVLDIVNKLQIDFSRVYLMPQGTDPTVVKNRGQWLARECQRYGFNYSHRIHVTLWGDERGT